jgi:peptidase E
VSSRKGVIALMGSGELTATMVEVHKGLLARVSDSPRAVFLDTPAGFQLNVDQLSQRAVEYFRIHIQQRMSVASFKSIDMSTPYEAEQAFHTLRNADFVLIGPGSPSYAVRQWRQTPIPEILAKRVEDGGCLVAASAAALTVGEFTLPVYEIYKVGEELHWVEGMDVLSRFGLDLVVVPHWNNAEGGTHDSRFCYMGEPRFRRLESLLPAYSSILGLDEHTACLIDMETEEGGYLRWLNFRGSSYEDMYNPALVEQLKVPYVSIESDAPIESPRGVTVTSADPRAYGSFPLVLSEYVRKRGLLSWEDAIKKMTYNPAMTLGLTDRGLLRKDYWADLVVFDPMIISHRAIFKNCLELSQGINHDIYPVGIDYTIVNGTIVVEKGLLTGARPGHVLRN